MKIIPIESVSPVYSCAKGTILKYCSIKFPELRIFSASLKNFIFVLGGSEEDDFWRPIIRKLRRFRFDLCAAPLTEEIFQNQLAGLLAYLQENSNLCSQMYPGAIKYYSELINRLDLLSNVALARLLDAINNLPPITYKDAVLVILEPRLVNDTEISIKNLPRLRNITIATPTLLRDVKCYQDMIIIGPTRWYDDYIFAAPRANRITIVTYSWMKDQWKLPDVFYAPIKQRSSKIHSLVLESDIEDDLILPEDILLPALDFQRLANKAFEGDANSVGDQEYLVDARIYLLEDGWAVFLEADDSASVLVFDFERDHTKPVQRVRIGDIQLGMFVLLRTGGGGDYIIPVADQIMGNDALIAREFQKEWKTHLRSKVKKLGYEAIIDKLKELGSERANRTNVHNWMSERSIKTDDIQDFTAIMRLIGLEHETKDYWDMMGIIDRAHLRAGGYIRKMLLEQVRSCDIDRLKNTGKMEFSIPGEQSVSITAFQVKDIHRKAIQVHPSRLNNPFEVEE